MEKLIRDKLLTLKSAKNLGKQLRIAKQEERKAFLMAKLQEEVSEVLSEMKDHDLNKISEEIGDVLEVIDGIIKEYNIDKKQLLKNKVLKKKNKGGFNRFFILKI